MTLTRTEASRALPGWRYLLGRMQLTVDAGGFNEALSLVNDVAALANDHDHHPEIDLRYNLVHLAMASHDVGAITDRDVALGQAISSLLEERGLAASHGNLLELEVAIDAMDIAAVRRFWQVATGYDPVDDDVLEDPLRIGPRIWFQQMDEPRPQRNRIHVDVTVAHDEVAARLAAVLAAGGRLLSDHAAPAFWVVTDPEGNEACLCTWQGRDEWDAATSSGAGEAQGEGAAD